MERTTSRTLPRLATLWVAAWLVLLSLASRSAKAADAPATGEIIYVPIYSSIFYQDGKRTLELAATLSIHNVDLDHPITVTRVDYYNTKGEIVRRQLAAPLVLKPLETKNFVVEKEDTSGGTGANFLVEWQSAETAVVSPIVEALMISAGAGQGISFTSAGKVVKRLGPAAGK